MHILSYLTDHECFNLQREIAEQDTGGVVCDAAACNWARMGKNHNWTRNPTISDPSQHVRRENLSHRESAMAGGALRERVTEKLDREERCIDGRSMPKYLK